MFWCYGDLFVVLRRLTAYECMHGSTWLIFLDCVACEIEIEVGSVRGCRYATQVKEFEDASDAGGHLHVVFCDRGDQPSPSMVLRQRRREGVGMCGSAAEGKAKGQVEWDEWFVMLAHASQLVVTMFFCSNIGCLV